jgi:hypothetical protein
MAPSDILKMLDKSGVDNSATGGAQNRHDLRLPILAG